MSWPPDTSIKLDDNDTPWTDCPACGQRVIPSYNGWRLHTEFCPAKDGLSVPVPTVVDDGWWHPIECSNAHDEGGNCLDDDGSIVGWRERIRMEAGTSVGTLVTSEPVDVTTKTLIPS